MSIYRSKRFSVASRHSPRFPLEQKWREHIQEALVKETVLNDGVAGPEQRGCSRLEEMSVIPSFWKLSYKGPLILSLLISSLQRVHFIK